MGKDATLHPPSLVGNGFRLVAFELKHAPLLREWESDVSSLYLWTIRKAISSEVEFNEALVSRLRDYYHTFLIITKSNENHAGFIYSYDANLVDGFVFVTTFLKPSSRQSGLGAKAGILFYNYLFSYYPLRKIYCDVFEYNEESLSALRKASFIIEGTFHKHRFFRGNYYTMYRLALYREQFYEKYNSIIHKLSGRNRS